LADRRKTALVEVALQALALHLGGVAADGDVELFKLIWTTPGARPKLVTIAVPCDRDRADASIERAQCEADGSDRRGRLLRVSGAAWVRGHARVVLPARRRLVLTGDS
jgi:hypothetical protein